MLVDGHSFPSHFHGGDRQRCVLLLALQDVRDPRGTRHRVGVESASTVLLGSVTQLLGSPCECFLAGLKPLGFSVSLLFVSAVAPGDA